MFFNDLKIYLVQYHSGKIYGRGYKYNAFFAFAINHRVNRK